MLVMMCSDNDVFMMLYGWCCVEGAVLMALI